MGMDSTPGETPTEALHGLFDCVNLIQRYPSGGWPRARAAACMSGLLEPEREVVVLFGRRVQMAYIDSLEPSATPVRNLDFFQWVRDLASPTGRRELVVAPNPDHLSSDPRVSSATRRRLGYVLREAVSKAAALYETRL
jgi:hypothetical protein